VDGANANGNSTWHIGDLFTAHSVFFVGGNENGNGGTALLSITNGGTVIVQNNGGDHSVTVGPSGTVTGNGTLTTPTEPTVDVKGTLAPSGTLSIGGSVYTSNLILENGAMTACNVTPQAADNVAISGTAALGGRLSVTMTGTFPRNITRFTLLHSSRTLTGTFGTGVSITYPPNEGFVPKITYDYVGNNVFLDLVFNQ
jgi:hypothetical protein